MDSQFQLQIMMQLASMLFELLGGLYCACGGGGDGGGDGGG